MNNPADRQKELARVRIARSRFSAKEASLSDGSSPTDLEEFAEKLSIAALSCDS